MIDTTAHGERIFMLERSLKFWKEVTNNAREVTVMRECERYALERQAKIKELLAECGVK